MIGGKRRRLFINREEDVIGIIAPRKRQKGYLFRDWDSIEKVCYPMEMNKATAKERERKLVLKYRKMAAKATFQSPFLRDVLKADLSKGVYENHLTTGTRIDGQVISLEAVRRWCSDLEIRQFKEAVRECRKYHSCQFKFRGYDGSLWVEPCKKNEEGYQPGDLRAGFSKEYTGYANGYYYLLINDNNFIGYDID